MLASTAEVNQKVAEYGHAVFSKLNERFHVELPISANDHHNELMKRAFEKGTKFVICVGPSEMENKTITLEGRQPYGSKEQGPVHWGTCSLEELMKWFQLMIDKKTLDENMDKMEGKPNFVKPTFKKKGPKTEWEKEEPSSAAKGVKRAQEQMAQGAKEEEAKKKQPDKAAVVEEEQSDLLRVGDEVFPTTVPAFKGKSFKDMNEFLRILEELKL